MKCFDPDEIAAMGSDLSQPVYFLLNNNIKVFDDINKNEIEFIDQVLSAFKEIHYVFFMKENFKTHQNVLNVRFYLLDFFKFYL